MGINQMSILMDKLYSNCCGVEDCATDIDGPLFSDLDTCPECREHCEFVEEDD